jgi:hypothetical protein
MKELFPTMGPSGSGKCPEIRADDHRLHGIFQPVRANPGERLPETHEILPLHGDRCEIGGGSSLSSCWYRRAVDASPGIPAHCVCDCAGGIPIGLDAAEDPRVAEICGACNIPSEIHPSRRTCLFLIPVRIWEDGRLRTGFSCRWFYSLRPERLPTEVWKVCMGCPHWFPRTEDEASIPRMLDWIHRIIRLYWEPEPLGGIWKSRPSAENTDQTPNSLLSARLYSRIKKFREALRIRRECRATPITRTEG